MNLFSGLKGAALREDERIPLVNFPHNWGLTWAGNSFDLRFDCYGNLRPGACANVYKDTLRYLHTGSKGVHHVEVRQMPLKEGG